MEITKLTTEQKLEALALKYYQDYQWQPKTGDYYTSSRNDLELYLIVLADDKLVHTVYCNPEMGKEVSVWKVDEFLTGFGVKRVYVPDLILNK
jgi:hypothetical protein